MILCVCVCVFVCVKCEVLYFCVRIKMMTISPDNSETKFLRFFAPRLEPTVGNFVVL